MYCITIIFPICLLHIQLKFKKSVYQPQMPMHLIAVLISKLQNRLSSVIPSFFISLSLLAFKSNGERTTDSKAQSGAS